MSDFELTPSDVILNVWISTGAAVLSLVLCSAVLGLAYYVWSRPHTRPMIDRISFRLLLWSVAFEVLYDITYILVEVDTAFGLGAGICTSSLYFMIASMTIVNYLCTAIAVNLMLTIVFHLNPVRLGLEKWYVGGSVFLGFFIPLVPAAMGHFANDPTYGTCWIAADSLDQLITRLVLDLYLWQILSCLIAVVAVIIVLVTLFRQGRELSAALFAGNELNQSIFGQQDSPRTEDGEEEVVEKAGRWTALWRKSRKSRVLKDDSSLRSQLEDKFVSIAFQISLYPISLVLVNFLITIGEIVVTKDGGVHSRSVYAMYCIYYFLYGGRGIAFAALAFFIDPCFRRALGEAWRTRHIRDFTPARHPLESSPAGENKQSFAEMLATFTPSLPYSGGSASTPYDDTKELSFSVESPAARPMLYDHHSSASSVDMPLALTALARVQPLPASPHKSLVSTRSFAGVPTGHLPCEFTDEIDVAAPTMTLLPRASVSSITPGRMTGLGVRIAGQDGEKLEPLSPDLPDEREEERLRVRAEVARKKAEEEQVKAEMDETMRVFLVTKAML